MNPLLWTASRNSPSWRHLMLSELALHLGHQPQMVGVRQLFQSLLTLKHVWELNQSIQTLSRTRHASLEVKLMLKDFSASLVSFPDKNVWFPFKPMEMPQRHQYYFSDAGSYCLIIYRKLQSLLAVTTLEIRHAGYQSIWFQLLTLHLIDLVLIRYLIIFRYFYLFPWFLSHCSVLPHLSHHYSFWVSVRPLLSCPQSLHLELLWAQSLDPSTFIYTFFLMTHVVSWLKMPPIGWISKYLSPVLKSRLQ